MNCLKIVFNIYLLTSIIRPNETIRLTDEFISLFTLSLKKKDWFSIITLSLSFIVLILFTILKPLLSNQTVSIGIIQQKTHEIKCPLTVCENKMVDEKDITSHSIAQEIEVTSLSLIDQKEESISPTVEQQRSIDSSLIMQQEENMHTSSYVPIEQKDTSAAVVETKVRQTETIPIATIEKERTDSTLSEIVQQKNRTPLPQTVDQEEPSKDQHEVIQTNNDASSHYLPLKQIHVMSVLPNSDMEQVIPFTITTSLLHESVGNDKLIHEQPYLTKKDEPSSEHDSSESEQSSASIQERQEEQQQQEGSSDELPSYQLSTTTFTCSRRSSETNATRYTAPKSQFEKTATSALEEKQPLKDISIVNEYNITPQPEKSSSSLSKNRFSSIRLKRKKSVNKKAAEASVPSGPKPSPKPSVSTKIQERLKKSGKRISKIFS